MGIGDEIIITGQARKLQEQGAGRVLVFGRNNSPRKDHMMWANNPYIATRSERVSGKTYTLINGPGLRPYIDKKTEGKWFWKNFECPVGEIYLSAFEKAFAHDIDSGIVIEPNMKQKASPNKDWGLSRWIRLTELLRAAGYRVSQLGPAGTRLIPGARLIETPSFRFACAVLAHARAAVLPEGGLHHAAAALGIKSVVIFGGFISPKQTGYAAQSNIFTGGEPCGMRVPCAHCVSALKAITPAMVMDKLKELL